jgi:hypothetical protein
MNRLLVSPPRFTYTCQDYWVPRLKRGMTPENVIGQSVIAGLPLSPFGGGMQSVLTP